ncbi:TPA: IS3 family transposase [Aeromonas veronii]|nr:IS3 family transposase [Aeromonas veronii]
MFQWELIKKNIYATRGEACCNVFDYIEMYYNLIRFHGSDDGLSPAEFESSSMFNNRVSRKLGAIQYAPARCALSVGCSLGAFPENWRLQPNQSSDESQ